MESNLCERTESDFSREKTCCFSGHRVIPGEQKERIQELLARRIPQLCDEGFSLFICGGALGFDTLAADAVLAAKQKYDGIRLSMAIPYPGYGDNWSAENRQVYRSILERADNVVYTSAYYHKFCMYSRNRYMVDSSGMLLCYMTEFKGGTFYTVSYALKKNLKTENIAMLL